MRISAAAPDETGLIVCTPGQHSSSNLRHYCIMLQFVSPAETAIKKAASVVEFPPIFAAYRIHRVCARASNSGATLNPSVKHCSLSFHYHTLRRRLLYLSSPHYNSLVHINPERPSNAASVEYSPSLSLLHTVATRGY